MKLGEFIRSLPIGEVKSFSHFNEGFQNTIYKIRSTKGQFCLRIYNKNKKSHISYEIAVLDRLRGLKVPRLIRVKGSYLIRFNRKYAILYEYIKGDNPRRISEKHLEQVGEFLAEFHKRVNGFTWNKYRYEWYNVPDWEIKKYAAFSRKKKLKYLEFLPDIIKDLRANRLDERLPKGPVHVDLSAGNSIFHKGELNGVVDFDNSYIGPFILDIGKSVMFFASSRKGKFDVKKAIVICRAYMRKRKLTRLEYKELYKAIKFAFLSHIFVDYYMRAIRLTTPEYFEYIINELYASYKSFKTGEEDFYRRLERAK